MKFVIFRQTGKWRWIFNDGVEVIALGEHFEDQRAAVEDARRFKSEAAKAEIEIQEKPWWPTNTSSKQPSS